MTYKMAPTFVSPALPCTSRSAFASRNSLTSLRPSGRNVFSTRPRRAVYMIGDAPVPSNDDAPAEDVADEPIASDEEAEVSAEVESDESGDAGDAGAPMAIETEDDDVEVLEECKSPQFVQNAEDIAAIRAKFRVHEGDTGSPEYQIATLTARIAYLTKHLKEHPKDHASTRGLLTMVAKRTKMLKYLKSESTERFHNIIEGLNIRISQQLRRL